MSKMNFKMMNHKVKSSLQAIPSMGITFIVLGVIILAASFTFNVKGNFLLFAGLFLIVAGVAGYVYSIKRG